MLAKRHRIAPALWARLTERNTAIPEDSAPILQTLFMLNAKRNRIILNQTAEIVSVLKEYGICGVLLKSLANIAEVPISKIGAYVTRDIDLLVRREDLTRAVSILEKNGYTKGTPIYGVEHSYPWLTKAGELVSVDLHLDIGPQRHLLDAGDALAVPEDIRGLSWTPRVLSPTHRVVHLIFHDQVQDRRFELGRISLHQLMNFAHLLTFHRTRIDWEEVSDRFYRSGYGSMFVCYCHMALELLGLNPGDVERSSWRARLHLDRCLAQIDWPVLQSIVTIWEVLTPLMSQQAVEYRFGTHSQLFRARYRLNYGCDIWRRNGTNVLRKIVVQKQRRGARR